MAYLVFDLESLFSIPTTCKIKFVGGPFDGKTEVFESCDYDQIGIGVVDGQRGNSSMYVPVVKGESVYQFKEKESV